MFIKIKKITKGTKKSKVYDIIGVPDNHNFVANSMVVHNCDEAIRFASAEDWSKKENKELKKVLGQVRTKHLFYILCFPLKVTKLDKTYLNSYVDYWLDLHARGEGSIFVKDKNLSGDVWNLKKFEKLGSWTEFTTTKMVEKKLAGHPNFWKLFKVPKVPKNVYARYLQVRESNVYDDNTVIDAMSKEDFQRAALIMTLKDLISRDGTLSMQRVIKQIDRIYKVDMSKQQLDLILKDSEQLLKKTSSLVDK